MPKKPEPKKIGRPKLPKGEAKGHFVGLRLNADDFKKFSAAANSNKQTVSEWIRSTLTTAIGG